jgi:cation:H+ antiporter
MGLGWPVIFFIFWFTMRFRSGRGPAFVQLPKGFSVEAAGLAVPVIYFLKVWWTRHWSLADGIVLCLFYIFYFWMLNRERKRGRKDDVEEHDEDEGWVVTTINSMSHRAQYAWILGMFIGGGLVLWFTVHPFVEALKTAALAFGVSEFVFIQWVAPIASEFPEKVTAFNWARKPAKVPMAIVNMLSSMVSQWTLLAGLVPIVFSLSAGRPFTIELSDFQRSELLLTMAQSALAVLFLSDLKVQLHEMIGLFALWLLQFFVPHLREEVTYVYVAWFAIELIRLVMHPSKATAWKEIWVLVSGREPRAAARKA